MNITLDTLHENLQDLNGRVGDLEKLIDDAEPTLFKWMLGTAIGFLLVSLNAIAIYLAIIALVQ